MAANQPSSMRRDIVSAYIAAGAKIASWAIVSAIVYRKLGATAFGLLALVRATIGLLNYAAVGLGPALVRLIAEETSKPRPMPLAVEPDGGVISYRTPQVAPDPASAAYVTGLLVAAVAGAIGLALTWSYARWFAVLHHIGVANEDIAVLVGMIGIGTVLRFVSDAPGAMLQTRGRICTDNGLLAGADVTWALMTASFVLKAKAPATVADAGVALAIANAWLLVARLVFAGGAVNLRGGIGINHVMLRRLLTMGGLVVLAQLADYLYAPTDYILIDRLLEPIHLAAYAPAVQIDGALLVLVSGLAAVLLPKSAMAHAAGDMVAVRRYYLRGTLASAGLLILAGIVVWGACPWIFRLWLGNPMIGTQMILPLVLVHTIIGGSSAVGRSILLGMGKVKAFTVSVLIAGVSNVLFSIVFVKYLHLGLSGIVLGTIVAVTLRCGMWMPWYVLRSLRESTAALLPLEVADGGASPTLHN